MDWFSSIKALHILCAALSIGGFTLRGLLKFRRPQSLQRRWIRIAPHVNDSILLACGLYLAFRLHQYPGTSSWLTAKLLGLVAYILFGLTALRFAKTRGLQQLAFVAALTCFSYIVAVAVTRNPWPFG